MRKLLNDVCTSRHRKASKTFYLSINAGVVNTKAPIDECATTLVFQTVSYFFIKKKRSQAQQWDVWESGRCEITLPYQTSSGKARIAVGVKTAPGLASARMGWSPCIRVAKDTAGVFCKQSTAAITELKRC